MSKLQVKTDVMDDIGVGAGLILTAEPTVDSTTHVVTIANDTILGATRGGITFNPNPQVRSRAIDGIASNTVGIHAVDRYEPTLSATFITGDLDVLLKAVGFGDISAEDVLTARHDVKATDYADLWFIELMSDGGSKLYYIKNAICTAGAAIKTNDNGETEIPLTFVGNYDLNDQESAPFTIARIPAPVTPEPTPEPTPTPTPTDNTEEQQ